MKANKQELQDIARQVQEGRYVTKGTLYLSVAISLFLGLYIGNLLTTIYSPAQPSEFISSTQPSQLEQPASQAQQIDPGLASQILKFEKITKDDPSNVAAWISLGHAYFDSDKPKPAIAAYSAALAIAPDNADVLTDLGVMYRRDGQFEKALEQFNKAMQLNPKHEQSRFNKGVVLVHDLNREAEGIAAWKDLISINPKATAPNGTPVSSLIAEHAK